MKVLVPISDDPVSETAIPEAVALAGADGHLVLASVGELPEVSEHREEIQAALRRRLNEAARNVRGVPVTERYEFSNDPVRGLVAIAREEQVDRIVIASQNRGAFEQLVDGSVAEDLKDELDHIHVQVVDAS